MTDFQFEHNAVRGLYGRTLIKARANVIGGCCVTTPEHIRQIAKILRKI